MNSLLIIGAEGYLGGHLARKAFSNWDTFLTYHTNKIEYEQTQKPIQLDIKKRDEVFKLICKVSPKVIIHTAAKTNSAFCEENKKEAWDTNVRGTENIALAAEQIKAKLIYISTDLVFDGTKEFYTEKDLPNPICYYGCTKFEGEKVVSNLCSDYIIVRTSLIYGNSVNLSKCATEKLIDNLKEKIKINLFFDEFRTPIYVKDLTKIILKFAEFKNTQETYNISGDERLSRYQFGLKIAEIYDLNKENIIRTSSDDQIANKYKRPKNCSLSNIKAKRILTTNFLTIEEGLKDMLGCI